MTLTNEQKTAIAYKTTEISASIWGSFPEDMPDDYKVPCIAAIEEGVGLALTEEAIKATSLFSPAGVWYPVENGLPPKFKNVLALSNTGSIRITCVDTTGELDEFELESETEDYWTHWCYLPAPPSPKQDNQ